MAEIGKLIRARRKELNMTQEKLARKLGYKSKTTIAKIENGTNDIVQSKVIEFAKALNTTVAYLMGWTDDEMKKLEHTSFFQNKRSIINVYGRVAATVPIEAIQDSIDEEEIPEELARTGEFFGLKISGDSMNPEIHDGDTVIVRRQDDAESDEIVIALISGNDGVCKRLKKYKDSISLISTNPSYAPMYFSQEEINNKPVQIIGKVVELRRKF